jgi:hypothetical protein
VRELFFRAGSDDPSLAALIAASGSRRPLRADSHGTPCRAEVA